MKVSNEWGVKNQFLIYHDSAIYFQSYNSIIAKKCDSGTYLDERFWDFSRTTGKYRNLFLGETKKETEVKIARGEYRLVNLNTGGM